jgi:hypothetical protein
MTGPAKWITTKSSWFVRLCESLVRRQPVEGPHTLKLAWLLKCLLYVATSVASLAAPPREHSESSTGRRPEIAQTQVESDMPSFPLRLKLPLIGTHKADALDRRAGV